MGNSKAKVGVIIQTNKEFYLPGDVVHGYVYINSPKPYPASKIILHILGVQKSWWRDSNEIQTDKLSQASTGSATSIKTVDSSGRKKMKMNMGGDRNAQCKILETSFVMISWNNQSFLHGQYSFPFQFMLPAYIPGSFKEESQRYRANIQYHLKTIIVSPRKQFPTIQFMKEFYIRENRKTLEESLYGQVYLYPMTFCCMKKGVSKVCCYFQKNQYLPGEQCIAICEVDNFKCSTAISEVKVKFIKCVTLMSAFGQQKQFIEEINNISFPGTKAHSMYAGENAQRLVLPLKYRSSNYPIHPSTSGRYVKCEYHLQVTPVVSGCCVKNSESFSVRLNILQPGMMAEKIEQPENWKPQVYQKSQIILSSHPQNQGLNRMNENY